MSDGLIEILAQVGILVVAVVGAFLAAKKSPFDTRKLEADTDLATVEHYSKLVADLRQELDRVRQEANKKIEEIKSQARTERHIFREELTALRKENTSQRDRIMRLENMLDRHKTP